MWEINKAAHLQPQQAIHIEEENEKRKEGRDRETVGMGKYECNASCIKHPLKTEPFSGEQTMFCGHYLIKFYGIQRTEDREEFCDSVELRFIK